MSNEKTREEKLNAIARLMWNKDEMLKKVLGDNIPDYFTKEDEGDMRFNFSEEEIDCVYGKLQSFDTGKNKRMVDVDICPYCILNNRDRSFIDALYCEKKCNYAKRHGICLVMESHYKKITSESNHGNIVDICGEKNLRTILKKLFGGEE